MQLQPKIVSTHQRYLVGISRKMSFSEFNPTIVWQQFMPFLHLIGNRKSKELISLTQYDPDHFKKFDPNRIFMKWAAAEVTDFDDVPKGMETLVLSSGLYAVFHYKGSAADNSVFQYIFNEWLPASSYQLDDRPHFEILGEKYDNHSPNSEEEIWIPVK